jgi:hypothetical protein
MYVYLDGLGWGRIARFRNHDEASSNSVKPYDFFDQLSNYELSREDSVIG